MAVAPPSRWHEKSCTKPAVVIGSDNTPRCTACHAAPDLKKIYAVSAEQHTPSSHKARPQTKEVGEEGEEEREEEEEEAADLNLRWPPSVRFTRPESSPSPSTASSQPGDTQPPVDEKKATNDPPAGGRAGESPSSSHSLIYGQRLAPHQFRLACLTPSNNPSHPVHLELETYEDNNCPEYETASYTWGGEDDDPTPCRPVFFGPYWDVSLHTKNCWELLRFARPRRGIRLIWIDALCINQADTPERNEQVRKMGSIFSNCMRVVVYLGPDLAERQAEGGRFPTRHRLHELPWRGDQPSPSTLQPPPVRMSMQEVLSRRYFTRIWVIQELVLSPQAVIRIGHADFVADARTSATSRRQRRPVFDGEKTVMPWLHMVSQQTLRVTDTLEALSIVRYSRATDPRDRLFGILGLIRHDQPEAQLQVDYSLSDRQLWIGFFAHVLLVEKTFWFLEFARGLGESVGRPSWVPRWESLDAWSDFVQPAMKDVKETFQSVCKGIAHGKGVPNLFFNLNSDIRTSSPMWADGASVCASTGALRGLRIQRAFTFWEAPTLYSQCKDTKFFRLEGADVDVCLASRAHLDQVIEPERDHLFVLHADYQEAIFLVLRTESGPWHSTPRASSMKPKKLSCIIKSDLPRMRASLVAICQFVGINASFEGLRERDLLSRAYRANSVENVIPYRDPSKPPSFLVMELDDVSCFGPWTSIVRWVQKMRDMLDCDLNELHRYWLLADRDCSLLSATTNEYLSTRGLRGPRYWHMLPIIWSLATCRGPMKRMISLCFNQDLLDESCREDVTDQTGVPAVRLNVPPSFWDGNGSALLRRQKSWPSNSKAEGVWRYKSAALGSQDGPFEWHDLDELDPYPKTWMESRGLPVVPVVFEMKHNFIYDLTYMKCVFQDEIIQLINHFERLDWFLGVKGYCQLEDLLRGEKDISEIVPSFPEARSHGDYGTLTMDGQEYSVDIC